MGRHKKRDTKPDLPTTPAMSASVPLRCVTSDNWIRLSQAVRVALSKRDLSHGWDHVERVATRAVAMVPPEHAGNQSMLDDLMAVAWLHDIEDHKYNDANLNDGALGELCRDHKVVHDLKRVRSIIRWISWSYQREFEQEYGREGTRKLMSDDLDADALLVRDLVSDADKLDAIGQVGWDRCLVYSSYAMQKKGVFGDLHAGVVQHCDDKLLQLHEYMISDAAKQQAVPLTAELRALRDRVSPVIAATVAPKPAGSWWPW